MTPHIKAKKEDIAKVVLMPGDPLRAKFIAETFLKDYICINDLRGMLGYTGFYKGKRVTVMGSGMGIASIGIYSHELFHFYDVDVIIRVGSCGTYLPDIKLGQVIIAKQAVSLSTYAQIIGVKDNNHQLNADASLVQLANDTANENNIDVKCGLVLSSDAFYSNDQEYSAWISHLVKAQKLLAVEMEAYGLYANAIKNNKKALTILSVSDSIIDHNQQIPAELRVSSFQSMMQLALDMANKLL